MLSQRGVDPPSRTSTRRRSSARKITEVKPTLLVEVPDASPTIVHLPDFGLGLGPTWLDLKGQMEMCYVIERCKCVRANLVKFPEVVVVVDRAEMSARGARQQGSWRGRRGPEALKRAWRSGELRRLKETGINDAAKRVQDILVCLAQTSPAVLLESFDSTGAGVLHCLLLSNTDKAIELAMQLVRLEPKLLFEVHKDMECFARGTHAHVTEKALARIEACREADRL